MDKRKMRKKKHKLRAIRIILSVMLSLSAILCAYNLKDKAYKYFQGNDSKSNTTQSSPKDITVDSKNYSHVVKNHSDINKGYLILVNNDAPFKFPEESSVISIYNNKNSSYKVSDRNVKLDSTVLSSLNTMMKDFEKTKNIKDILINSGYRTKEEQDRVLKDKIKQLGAAQAANWATMPGNSEHHTGFAMDISIYKDNGTHQSFTGSGKYSWINENCGNYGFILRYSGDKTKITGISNEPWHYRYVGVPHANIIKDKGFCLEEYINHLKNYSSNSNHLEFIDFDKTRYEIYYVEATKEKTKIPVPKNSDYSISGNNVDGFIVTVKK